MTVDLPLEADPITTDCAAARQRIREAFDAAKAVAASWDLPTFPAR